MRALLLLLFGWVGFSLAAEDRVATVDSVRHEIHQRSLDLAELQSRIRLFQSRVSVLNAKVNASEGMTRCLAIQDLRFWEERLLAERMKLNNVDADLAPYVLQLEQVLRTYPGPDQSVDPGDLIGVTIMPEALHGQYRVNERGYVLLPHISLLYVGCLSVRASEQEIEDRLADRGFPNAWVHLQVVDETPPAYPTVGPSIAQDIIALLAQIRQLEGKLAGKQGPLEWYERLKAMEILCGLDQDLNLYQRSLEAAISPQRMSYTTAGASTLDGGFQHLISDHLARVKQLDQKVAALEIRVQIVEYMLADDSVTYTRSQLRELEKDLRYWQRRLGEARIEAKCHTKLTDAHSEWLQKAMKDTPVSTDSE
ncbi:MAG: hypothetical protein ACI8W8_000983 [Rhodothermales bacterium]|jgi:hypothetical protein